MLDQSVEIVLLAGNTDSLVSIVERIGQMVDALHRDVVVAINGSSVHVGKTYVSRKIHALFCAEKKVCVAQCNDFAGYDAVAETLCGQGVLLFDALGFHECMSSTEKLEELRADTNRNLLRRSGGRFSGVDFWIGVYRPGSPFREQYILADVLIRNEGARDK